MALVSIITACTRPGLLLELAASVLAQDGDWEWLVQLDGQARSSPALGNAIGDDRVRVAANPCDAGSATTRNLALQRSVGKFVLCVDDDDLLAPGAVEVLASSLSAHRDCFAAWGRSRVFDDDPTRSREFKAWSAPGVVGPNEIGPIFEATGEFPVHVGACLWRRTHLEAVGGYAALLRSIDTNPFLACERVFPLVYVDQDVYLYREHVAQMTKDPYYDELRAMTHDFNFARRRAIGKLSARLRGDDPPDIGLDAMAQVDLDVRQKPVDRRPRADVGGSAGGGDEPAAP